MKKVKIGRGYYQSGHGRGFKKNVAVWLINGKLYIKDSKSLPYETDLKGHTMINKINVVDKVSYVAVGIISDHKNYLP